MTDGTMLGAGQGRLITGGGIHATLKVPGGPGAITSTFEMRVPPGFDVGAHYHTHGEELFYIVSGELEVLAFEPVDRTVRPWTAWTSSSGLRPMRGGPGTVLHVPAGCPHAFRNPTDEPVTMLFQSAPAGHEDYFVELAELLVKTEGRPSATEMKTLRLRHDIHQISNLRAPNAVVDDPAAPTR